MPFQQISLPMRSLLSGAYNLARSFLRTPAPNNLTEINELYYTPIELYVFQTTDFNNTYGWSCYINYSSASDPYPNEINIVINKNGVAIPVTMTYQGVEGTTRRWYRSGASGSYTFTLADIIWINGIEYDDQVPPDEITGVATHFAIRANTLQGDIQPLKAGLYSRVNVGTSNVTACFVDYFEYDTMYLEYVQSGLGQQIVLDNLYSFDSDFRRNFFGEINDTETNLIISPDTIYVSPDKIIQDTVSVRITSKEPVPYHPPITEEEIMSIEEKLLLIYSAVNSLAKDITLQEISGHTEVLSEDPITCEQMTDNTMIISSATATLTAEITALKNSLDAIGEQVEYHTENLIGIHSAQDSLLVSMASQLTEFQAINGNISSGVATVSQTLQSFNGKFSESNGYAGMYDIRDRIAGIETAVNTLNANIMNSAIPALSAFDSNISQSVRDSTSNLQGTVENSAGYIWSAINSVNTDIKRISSASIGIYQELEGIKFVIEDVQEDIETGLLQPLIQVDATTQTIDDNLSDWDDIRAPEKLR